MVHNNLYNQGHLIKIPGSLPNTKHVFNHRHVNIQSCCENVICRLLDICLTQATKDVKSFAASWDLMTLNCCVLLAVLAQEALEEQGLQASELSEEQFSQVVAWILARVSLLPAELGQDFPPELTAQDDDQLRSMLLGLCQNS